MIDSRWKENDWKFISTRVTDSSFPVGLTNFSRAPRLATGGREGGTVDGAEEGEGEGGGRVDGGGGDGEGGRGGGPDGEGNATLPIVRVSPLASVYIVVVFIVIVGFPVVILAIRQQWAFHQGPVRGKNRRDKNDDVG